MSTSPLANPLNMTDDEFSKMSGPPPGPTAEEIAAAETAAAEAAAADADADDTGDGDQDDSGAGDDNNGSDDTDGVDDTGAVDGDASGDDDKDGDKDDVQGVDPNLNDQDFVKAGKPEAKPAEGSGDAAGTQGAKEGLDPAGKPATDAPKDGDKPSGPDLTAVVEPDEATLKTIYHKIMTPFKANGKMITLKDPDEAIQLMQMGANYTRKMQELQPKRKLLMMLESNELDEAKLSYLIDLDKKNPEAIKQLIKDSGIDPLDIDTEADPGYKPGQHELTDNEVAFRATLDDISQTPEGKNFIVEVNNKFDEASKEVLWKQPEIISVLHEQRESGVYALITEEMDRQITLGKIPANTPFLDAYKIVGDELSAQAADAAKSSEDGKGPETGQTGKPAPVIVGTRTAAPKQKVANGDRANAASSTRATPSVKEPFVNPLAMSDDEFLKKMAGRV